MVKLGLQKSFGGTAVRSKPCMPESDAGTENLINKESLSNPSSSIDGNEFRTVPFIKPLQLFHFLFASYNIATP